MEEPTNSEPTTDPLIPEVESEEYVAVVEEPVAAVEEPVAAVEEPVAAVEEPVASAEEPVAAAEEPVAAAEEPVAEVHVAETFDVQTTEDSVVDETQIEQQQVTVEPTIQYEIQEPVSVVPKIIFIVPYRDRSLQQEFFARHMTKLLEDMNPREYKIYYAHQKDEREFNRGAMKNIGFLAARTEYPDDYKNITFVFNDIDTMPFTKNFLNYETAHGVVKHFYGFKFALGGIVSIKGGDFEKVNGFPNFWAWGYEDNLLQKRVQTAGLTIDRSQFYPIMDQNILQTKDGLNRLVNRSEFDQYLNSTAEGLDSITGLSYHINPDTGFLDITAFETGREASTPTNETYDLRNGGQPFKLTTVPPSSRRRRGTMGMII